MSCGRTAVLLQKARISEGKRGEVARGIRRIVNREANVGSQLIAHWEAGRGGIVGPATSDEVEITEKENIVRTVESFIDETNLHTFESHVRKCVFLCDAKMFRIFIFENCYGAP